MIKRALFTLCLAAAFAACAPQDAKYISLARESEPITKNEIKKGIVSLFKENDLKPPLIGPFADRNYKPIRRGDVQKLIDATDWQLLKYNYRYGNNIRDCDKFMDIMRGQAMLMLSLEKDNYGPMIYSVWLKLDSGENHAIVGIYTDEGTVFIEPQKTARRRMWDAFSTDEWKGIYYVRP